MNSACCNAAQTCENIVFPAAWLAATLHRLKQVEKVWIGCTSGPKSTYLLLEETTNKKFNDGKISKRVITRTGQNPCDDPAQGGQTHIIWVQGASHKWMSALRHYGAQCCIYLRHSWMLQIISYIGATGYISVYMVFILVFIPLGESMANPSLTALNSSSIVLFWGIQQRRGVSSVGSGPASARRS